MTLYLLDTNAVSSLISDPVGRVALRVGLVGEASVYTSVIVAAEIRFGLVRKHSPRLTKQAEIVLGGLAVEPFDQPADLAYAKLRAELEVHGRLIGSNDLLIAAHALATDAILVTDNTREFERVPGLKIENWLRD